MNFENGLQDRNAFCKAYRPPIQSFEMCPQGQVFPFNMVRTITFNRMQLIVDQIAIILQAIRKDSLGIG